MNRTMFNDLFDCVINEIKTNKSHQTYAVPLCDQLRVSKNAIYGEQLGINNLITADYKTGRVGFMGYHRDTASVMIAFLKKLSGGGNWTPHAKERVAIFVGLTALRSFIENDAGNYNNAGLITLLTQNDGVKLPALTAEDDSYEKSWALELHQAHAKERLFVPSLANELFCIEAYNRRLAEM
jgi:hypothetical protein